MKQESGFTVVELLVVTVIIIALALASAGGWYSFIPGYRLNAANGEFQAALQIAKLRAIKENAPVSITVTGGGGSPFVPITYTSFVDNNQDFNLDTPGDITIMTETLNQSLYLDGASATQIQFNTRGFPVAAASFLMLSGPTGPNGRGIQVNAAGGTRMMQSSNGGASWTALTYE